MRKVQQSPARFGALGLLMGIGLAAAVAFILRHPATPGARSAPRACQPVGEIRDIVDIASEESFPASDAPAY